MQWWNEVEAVIEKHSLLKHPFYQAWQDGRLSQDDLAYYAKQYYKHVRDFPRYVSAVHSNTEDLATRQMLLENLNEEEAGSENHPELWKRFAEGLGVSRDAVENAELRPESEACVETYHALARDKNPLVGLAALYAYESQIPAISKTKLEGLASFYGITDERSRKFFSVHEKADVWHSKVERDALMRGAATDADKAAVKQAVTRACEAVESLLDGVVEARGIASFC